MAKLIYGDRIGKLGAVFLGCSATIFDQTRRRILLTCRADNGQWCLPGGRVEAGESVAETCTREVYEETSLNVRVVRLIGVYSDPNRLVEYQDGNRYHAIVLNFEAEAIGGELGISEETTSYGYYSQAEIELMDVMANHRERIVDVFAEQVAAFVR